MARRGPPRGRRTALLGLLAALALVIAGCGGGGDSGGESESASRRKLEVAAEKVSKAKSLRLSLAFEIEEDGDPEEIGCLDLAVDTAKPESVDLMFFDLNCAGGVESNELIAVGHRAWGSTGPGSWREAKITPALLHELSDEQTDFGELMAAAEDITATAEGSAVEEGEGEFVDVTGYSFEAPASAFPGSADLGDLKVEFEATLDHRGYLRELVVHGEEDGAGATVTANYERIDEPQEIEPPSKSEVKGPATTIDSREELDALFGLSTP
ncbi:MAG: hypothetical protein JST53_12680 [Actinobacteria bacterium]|nr:hypothetical protein [Actinomycetota bacterium]